jgi:uncharacterized protein YoaH (UPF0181 family)
MNQGTSGGNKKQNAEPDVRDRIKNGTATLGGGAGNLPHSRQPEVIEKIQQIKASAIQIRSCGRHITLLVQHKQLFI